MKRLSGFKKRSYHYEPDDFSEYAENFIVTISRTEIQALRDRFFRNIREQFGYLRADINVHDHDGGFTIICRDFEVQMSIAQSRNNPAEYEISIEAWNIRDEAVILSDAFNEVFNGEFDTIRIEFDAPLNVTSIIDSIEAAGDPTIEVEYDSDQTACRVLIGELDGYIEVSYNTIAYVNGNASHPVDLYRSFWDSIRALSSQDIIALPGDTG